MKKILMITLLMIVTKSTIAQDSTTTTTTIYTPTLAYIKQKIMVTNVLMQLSGVIAVNISLDQRQTNVTYNTALCNKQLLKQNIYNLGYSADEMVVFPAGGGGSDHKQKIKPE